MLCLQLIGVALGSRFLIAVCHALLLGCAGQSILTLVHLRRAHHLFPIRSYLPGLIDTLEDTDGAVRECARQSIVELFTGPGVTDAARADLKKELTKKGVRKTIVDSVLSKVLSAGSGGASTPATMSEAGSENGDAGHKEYVPPSIALMNRRPGTSAGPGSSATVSGLPRTMSQGSVKDFARPSSRAGVTSPPPTDGASGAGSGATDVKPVYVSLSTRPYFQGDRAVSVVQDCVRP